MSTRRGSRSLAAAARARERLQQRRAVGQALRAAELRRPDHGGRSRSGRRVVHRPRLRGARGRARRHRQPRRRLRLQLRIDACVRSHQSLHRPRRHARAGVRCRRVAPCCRTTVPTCCTTATTAAASRSMDRRCWCARSSREKYSVSANYYVDMVSSASIDVMTTASPYKEERTQGSLGFDMLHGKTQYSVGYTLQRRERLHGEHGQLRPEPGHVRRPDDRVVRLQPGLGRSAQAR